MNERQRKRVLLYGALACGTRDRGELRVGFNFEEILCVCVCVWPWNSLSHNHHHHLQYKCIRPVLQEHSRARSGAECVHKVKCAYIIQPFRCGAVCLSALLYYRQVHIKLCLSQTETEAEDGWLAWPREPRGEAHACPDGKLSGANRGSVAVWHEFP